MKKNKKSKLSNIFTIIAILLIIAGLAVLIFPKITNYIYDRKTSSAQKAFTDEIVKNNTDELYELLKSKNEELYANHQKTLSDPFSYSQAGIDLSKYGIKDNVIGYITIPKIDETMPIRLGANSKNLQKGAVHLTNTSYPIGGNNTNSVIAAHRGWSTAKMLRHIEQLEIGDKIYIQNFREKLTYTVSEIEIIKPTDVDKLLIQDNKDMITLITCHPFRVNSHRYVVYCEREKSTD